LPLDIEECRTAIWRAGGNITEASRILKISSMRLRNFVKKSAYLSREMEESKEIVVDKAESVIVDALDDPERRDSAARFVLERLGKPRGWGAQTPKLNINNQGGTVVFQWADGSEISGDEGKVIDVSPADTSE
jgi:hypothetical protein